MNNVCPVENDTIRHYADAARSEDLQAEVNRYVKLYTGDRQGITTLIDEMPEAQDIVEKLLVEIITVPVDQRTITQVIKLRAEMFVIAAKLAGRKIAADIKAAQEDHAVERFMWRQEARCEP